MTSPRYLLECEIYPGLPFLAVWGVAQNLEATMRLAAARHHPSLVDAEFDCLLESDGENFRLRGELIPVAHEEQCP